MTDSNNPMEDSKSEIESTFEDIEALIESYNREIDDDKKETYEEGIEDSFGDILDYIEEFKVATNKIRKNFTNFTGKLSQNEIESYLSYYEKSKKRAKKLQNQFNEYRNNTESSTMNSHSNIHYNSRAKKRDALLEDSEMNTNIFGFEEDAPSSTATKYEHARQEDNDQFIQLQLQKQRDIMENQDKKLDFISEKATTLSNILVDIDDNLEEQKRDIRHLTTDIEKTTSTIKRLRNRIDRLIAGTSDKGKILCIVVLIIIIAILIIVLAVI